MGIGTSLGAYFETSLDHHAGNEYLLNPNSTPDNNELSTNEVMPKPDEEPKIIPVADIKTASPLVTITDEDIDKGMALGLSFSGGGLSTNKVIPMRKAANDNKPSGVIERPELESILKSWDIQVARHQRGNDIIQESDKLMQILTTRNWNDLEKHRFNKLTKEHEELFKGNYPD